MRTCPEAGLTASDCKAKYPVWDSLILSTQHLTGIKYSGSRQLAYDDYKLHYDPNMLASKILWSALTGDITACVKDPGLTEHCVMAAATFIPGEKLLAVAKEVTAFRLALITGIGIDDARLTLQAALTGVNQAAMAGYTALADSVVKFRQALKDGIGIDAALAAVRNNPNADQALIDLLANEGKAAQAARAACKVVSVPGAAAMSYRTGSGAGTSPAVTMVSARMAAAPGPIGCLEGLSDYDVFDPVTGNKITDIDFFEGKVLWEKKSVLGYYGDEEWLTHLGDKLGKYLDARKELPDFYHDAEIGFWFTRPNQDPRFVDLVEKQVQKLRDANPGITIVTRWA
jgi:hypothetical protein